MTVNTGAAGVSQAWQATAGVVKVTAQSPDDAGTAIDLLVDDSNRVLPGLFEAAAAQGVRITSVDIREPNLEAVFLHLTGRALRD